MGASKNDVSMYGGKLRIFTHPHRGQQDAIVRLIDPITQKPFTHERLLHILDQRCEEYPTLAGLIQPKIDKIKKKIQRAAKPDSVFEMHRRAPSKEEAIRLAYKELVPRLADLLRLVYRPLWVLNVKTGQATINQYVDYVGDGLIPNSASPGAKKRITSALRNVVLPVIGSFRIADLTAEQQKKLIRKINSNLSKHKSSATLRSYTKRAYIMLFSAIEQDGYQYRDNPVSFAALINAKRDQNRALTKAYRQDHLDASLRTALFALLQSQPDHYDALLVAMIYSGLTLSELAALRFGDVRRLHLRSNDDCYCIVADKLVRKVGSRYSTISAQNDEYPIQKLRKVVLYPWAADILLQRVQELLQQGLKMPQISDMRFSDLGPACPIQGPKEIESRLVPFMRKAGIQDDVLPRTSRDGVVSASTLRVTCDLLIRDAQYVAEHLCGADSVMLHAMFGHPWTTTDEQNYLDILSDLYAVTRYFRLHRFCPFSQDTLAPRTRTVWRLTNPLQSPQTVKMRTKYGVTVAWKKATSNESN
ncbi:hypothetical protein [uncultured Subdoligranulum sp.]|uniref:hypothetical protein n=1 Tax=uncultured Subdoligranulum sp. TaxID=512298 RepID=UPI00262634B5|nr:hypothetical protein [uncultured Subdoligranulum sp.]